MTVVLQNGGVLALTEDLTVEELELVCDAGKDTSVVRVRLNGHTLKIRSRRHKDGKRGWPTNWNASSNCIFIPGADAEGNPGKVVWEPRGLRLIVR